MLEKIKYINHMMEEMTWGESGIFVNYNDLRDFSWGYTSANNRISSFHKGIAKKKVPIIIFCENEEEGYRKRDELFELCEKDVLAMKHGKIIIGDYYLKCYVTGSIKTNYLRSKGYMEAALEVTTDFPSWVKETTTQFRSVSQDEGSGAVGGKNFDFNYDFPFDYSSEFNDKRLKNSGFVGTAFKIIIYGSCSNPAISINDHTYQVNADLSDNEYLTIDSMTKTIVLTKYDGQKENCFHLRNRESYIFEHIPPGENIITWNGAFGFDVILLDERSEPKWI